MVFLGEGKVGVDHGGVVWDEAMVEVGEAQEGLYFLDFGRSGPAGDSIKFDWVHGELPQFDYHAEVFHLRGGKLAFLQFQVEV